MKSARVPCILVVVANFLWSPLALPQAGQSLVIEEIIVTAQKREQSLQDVPLSVAAFDESALRSIGVDSLDDLTLRTPNINYEQQSDIKLSTPTVRGVFGGNSGGKEPALGVYVDEVYMGNSVAASLHLYDLERAEILRGPQGTLFGRNTTAGGLSYTTKRPSLEESGGYLSLRAGNFGLLRAQAAIGGPLVDGRLAGRIATVYHEREGFSDNVFLGRKVNDESYYALRASLLYQPDNRSDWRFTVDYRDLDQSPLAFETIQPNPLIEFGLPFPANPGATFQFSHDGDPHNFSMSANFEGRETLDGFGAALHGTMEFNELVFNSITAYRTHDYYSATDTDRTPIAWATDGDPEDQEQFSQEFRLTSSKGDRFDWIAGLYFFSQDTDNTSFATVEVDLVGWIGIPLNSALYAEARGIVETDSYAAFGQGIFRFSDKAAITVGLRVSRDEKSVTYRQDDESSAFVPGGLVGVVPLFVDSASWTEPTGDFTFSYNWTDDWMGYLQVARGYKAGGYNDALGSSHNPSFDPEYVLNFEAGVKLGLANNRVLLNASAFSSRWDDIQISAFTTIPGQEGLVFGVLTGNFGKAEANGLEVELQALATENLSLYANLGLLDGEITQGDPTLPGEEPIIAAGNKLPGPEMSATVGGEMTWPLGDGNITLRGDYVWTGERELILAGADGNNPAGHQDAFGLLNARLIYRDPDGAWELSIWGNNLTDERYNTRVIDFTFPPILSIFSTLGSPRMFGIGLRRNF